MSTNGHEPRRFRVPVKAGQFVVVVNDWDGEVDGPHPAKKDGYKYAIQGRRTVHVFDDYDKAMRFAEAEVTRLVEEQGEDI